MNNERRKDISIAVALLERAKDILDDAKVAEEEYRDNMPENMQSSERWEAADAVCSALDDAVTSVEEAIDGINELDGVTVDVKIGDVRQAVS